MKRICSIDPGAKGGMAWVAPEGVVECMNMPLTNGDTLAALQHIRRCCHVCYIEHVVGFIPGGGAGAMFSFGENFGYLQGVLDALEFRVIRVRPQQWQKALNLGNKAAKIKADKDASSDSKKAVESLNRKANGDWKLKLKAESQRRFPHLAVNLQTADALLILDYGRQQL